MIRLEKRASPSVMLTAATPVLAVVLTMLAGGLMFSFLGKPPLETIKIIFWDPLFHPDFSSYTRPQLLVKAGPLILIGIGLSQIRNELGKGVYRQAIDLDRLITSLKTSADGRHVGF